MGHLVRESMGGAIALLSIFVLVGVGLWVPYLMAAPNEFETQYEVRK